MTILLTGGAGFIGSHLTDQLLTDGHTVICLDNIDDYYEPALKRANVALYITHPNFLFVLGDVRDGALLNSLFGQYPIQAVIHLAARAGVRPSVQNPSLYVDVNINGTLTLLEAMRRVGVKKMVLASSSSVYGNGTGYPVQESDVADRPLSPYAASKRGAELLAHTYHHLYGFDIMCLRFFTVYGPRQRPEMAISQFTHRILHHKPITFFGNGSTSRDYTFVTDTVTGIVLALHGPSGFWILNIGSNDPVSLRRLVDVIEQTIGHPAQIDWQPMQPGDVEHTRADLTLAQQVLGYAPKVSLASGIQQFINWSKMRGL